MKDTLINYRLTSQTMQVGLIRLLLTLILATASLPAFSASNSAPVISGMPATSVVTGSSYYFQPTATDANRDRLRFRISNKPAWASFSRKTGRLSGTPGAASVGTYSNIVISVSDRKTSTSLPAFSIQVDAAPEPAPEPEPVVNKAPRISGSPAGTAMANERYVFQPSASDVDVGDQLTFSISGKPVWASFNTGSGRLRGTPANRHVGTTYSNIVISVTDGIDTVSLPAFSIRVDAVQVLTGSFDVSWTAPVTRADGEPISLADINGYRIHYGDASGNYTDVAEVPGGATTSATVTDVPVGTCYVVMTTYDVDGRESGYSQEITKLVQ